MNFRHNLLFLLLLSMSAIANPTFPTPSDMPSSWPVQVPQLQGGRLTVVSQNLQYYYVVGYEEQTQCDYHTEAEMIAKTQKVAQAMVLLDADIYAFCELEPGDSAINYLAHYMNALRGENVYRPVADNLNDRSQWSKNGYIYRADRVAAEGKNLDGNTLQGNTYKYRQRLQAFRELTTNEVFVLSTNHFKSKSGDTNGSTQSTRNKNATNLLTRLTALTLDPDILIVGDLNETTAEPACQILCNAGYEEQLERFNPNAYSYYYNGNELIDHIFANSTMAEQITDAGAFHLNTSCYSGNNRTRFRYSDHDAVMVSIALQNGQASSISSEQKPDQARRISLDGQIYIYRSGRFYTLDGRPIQ